MNEPTSLWCAACAAAVDFGPELQVVFHLSQADLDLEGNLDLESGECFLDYWHLACGTKMRLSRSRIWEEEIFAYVSRLTMVEVDNDLTGLHHVRFDNFDAVWLAAYEVLCLRLDAAVRKFHAR